MKIKNQTNHYINKIGDMLTIRSQIRLGGIKYISFILLDLLCLFGAYVAASRLYLERVGVDHLSHGQILIQALIIDVVVTLLFNTLNRVLRRGPARELFESIKHIMICFVILTLCLFMTKRGAEYSRVVIVLTYLLDLVLIFILRNIWKWIMNLGMRKHKNPTALVMTADSFVFEALDALKDQSIDVRDIYLLKNRGISDVGGIPVVNNADDAASAICWEQIDNVYIYGLNDQAVPDEFIDQCRGMGVGVDLIDFGYRIVDLKTINAQEPGYGKLTVLESRRDIPFPIRRVYWITETEADLHRGFHAHKLNCQLLFCPHGSIDIILDDGKKKETVHLDDPTIGLILMPGLWREMIWKESGSVLGVLASEYYDPKEYIRDYDEFLEYSKQCGPVNENEKV